MKVLRVWWTERQTVGGFCRGKVISVEKTGVIIGVFGDLLPRMSVRMDAGDFEWLEPDDVTRSEWEDV